MRLFPVFSAAFAVLYVALMHYNIAAVIYYPRLGEWHLKALGRDGPPMFLYGWMIYAFLGAVAVSLLAALVPKTLARKVWSGWTWVICLGALLLSAYLMYSIWLVPKPATAAAVAPAALSQPAMGSGP